MANVIITGAVGGIGRHLVEVFTAAGYSVIASDMLQKPDELICAAYVQADLERFVECTAYAESVLANFKTALNGQGLSVLINNAAIQILGGASNLRRDDWRKSLNINLLAPFFVGQEFLGELEAASGCIINISSIHARLTKKNFVSYATSKAALSGMTRAMAVDIGSKIRINAIEPAAVHTPMLKAGFKGKPELYSQLESNHPQQRIATPEEIAKAALWLASSEAGFLNGACIAVDGGISARLHDPD